MSSVSRTLTACPWPEDIFNLCSGALKEKFTARAERHFVFFPATDRYPTPAVIPKAINHVGGESSKQALETKTNRQLEDEVKPGKLPKSADQLPTPARGLLLRLLERDPKVRLRNLRQLQQSAFYMSFNFDHVKAKKVQPKSLIEKHFPDGPPGTCSFDTPEQQILSSFDQLLV